MRVVAETNSLLDENVFWWLDESHSDITIGKRREVTKGTYTLTDTNPDTDSHCLVIYIMNL